MTNLDGRCRSSKSARGISRRIPAAKYAFSVKKFFLHGQRTKVYRKKKKINLKKVNVKLLNWKKFTVGLLEGRALSLKECP